MLGAVRFRGQEHGAFAVRQDRARHGTEVAPERQQVVARAILAHGDCPVFLTPEPHRAEHKVRGSSISGVMY